MPLTFDDSQIKAGLERFLAAQLAGIEQGLEQAASVAQSAMQTSPAHGDQSGATHASYTAYVIGGTHDGSAEAAAGYAAAAGALSGFTGHAGNPVKEDSGVTLQPDERGVILTSFTDYQDKLEQSEKAVLTPTLAQYHEFFTRSAADGAKNAR